MNELLSRRNLLYRMGSIAALPFLIGKKSLAEDHSHHHRTTPPASSPAPLRNANYVPVVTPGVSSLPYRMEGGVKVFELVAEAMTTTFPDLSDPHGMKRREVYVWGYNGSMIGPTLEAVEGDTVRILFKNNLPESTTVHFHGIELPIEMDGVPGFSQEPVPPGGTFVYEFPLEQSGTYFYHSHQMAAKQIGLGLMGFFIVHPKNPRPDQIVDKDYAFFLHTWKINPGSPVPDTLEMTDFNYFTMNGRVGPDIPPMLAKIGEKVRIRVTNLSMLSHPVHLHGHTFKITELGGGFLPPHQQMSANTTSVSAAEVRTVEFEAARLGKWMFHCHFSHHTMNDMHRSPLIGNPSMANHAMHDMGGMSTWIEITK